MTSMKTQAIVVTLVVLLFTAYGLARGHSSHPYHSSKTSHVRVRSEPHGYRRGHIAEGYRLHPTVRTDSHGRIKRSREARDVFERQHPCPSTGKTHGSCRGYVVDHVHPLECGGADAPFNMQWQTEAAAKAKDKTESSCRL